MCNSFSPFVYSQFLYSGPAVSFWSTNLRENSFIQKICKNPEFQIRPKGKIRFDINQSLEDSITLTKKQG